MGFPGGSVLKNLPVMQETCKGMGLIPVWGRSLEKEMSTHSSIFAWKSHGQRSLMSCSSRGRKESDITEQQQDIG